MKRKLLKLMSVIMILTMCLNLGLPDIRTRAQDDNVTVTTDTDAPTYDYSWMDGYTDEEFMAISGITKDEWKEEYPDLTFEDFGLTTYAAGDLWTVTSKDSYTFVGADSTLFDVTRNGVTYLGFCMDRDKGHYSGSYTYTESATVITDPNNKVYQALYYGYNGPEEGAIYTFGSTSEAVVATSQAVSHFYVGSSSGLYYVNALENLADEDIPPAHSMSFSTTTPTVSISGNLQKTENITLNMDSRLEASVTIPTGVTLVYNGTSYTGNANLPGGAAFYLQAPITTTMDATLTAAYTGNKLLKITVLETSNSAYQPVAYYDKINPSVSLTAEFVAPLGDLEIIKSSSNPDITDGNSCYSLAGAVYGVYKYYSDAQADTNRVTIITTDASGYGKATDMEARSYYVKEVTAPKGYALDTTIYPVTVNAGAVATQRVEDVPQMDPVSIFLTKQGNDGVKLEGAEFTVKFYEGVQTDTDPAKSGYTAEKTWVLKTDGEGYCRLNNIYKISGDDFYYDVDGIISLPLGTLTIQETKAPDGYILDDTVYVRQITSEGNVAEVNTYNAPVISNDLFKAYLKVVKKDSESGESILNNQATFKIWDYAAADYVTLGGVSEFKTNDEGVLVTPEFLLAGSYRLDETKAPSGYIPSEEGIDFVLDTETIYETYIDDEGNTTDMALLTIDVENDAIKGSVKLLKENESGDVLSGVKFNLYKKNNGILYAEEDAYRTTYNSMTSAEKNAVNKYKEASDDLFIGSYTTDANGSISVNNLCYGEYYFVETATLTQYVLDSSTYSFEIVGNGDAESITVVNEMKKQPFAIQKYGEAELGDTPLAGAGFMACPVSELTKDADGNYIWDSSKAVVLTSSGSKEMFTNLSGYVESIPLPYGLYLCKETTVPENYHAVDEFMIDITENKATPQLFTFTDKSFKGYFKILKIDEETGKSILNNSATFRIYNYNTKAYVSFNGDIYVKTNDQGELITPSPLFPGMYRIEEVEAPIGYVEPTETYEIEISDSVAHDTYVTSDGTVTDMGLFTLKVENKAVDGCIELIKKGEVTTFDKELGEYVSTYVELMGVQFDIYAAEDLYTADGQGTKLYDKGDKVATVTTDADGYAKTGMIPLGKYTIKEVTPEGYVAVDDIEVTISLDSDISNGVAYETVEVTNMLQRAVIKVNKTDAYGVYALAGVEFGLYEYNPDLADRKAYMEQGVMVASGVTDDAGELVFPGYYPIGKYALVEHKACEGYVTSEEVHIIDAAYDPSAVTYVSYDDTFTNESIKGSVQLLKYDMEDNTKTLEGVKFNLYKKASDIDFAEELGLEVIYENLSADEKIAVDGYKLNTEDVFVGEFITDANGKISVENLCYGEYYFIETETLKEYVLDAEFQVFYIANQGEVIDVAVDNAKIPPTPPTGDSFPLVPVLIIVCIAAIGLIFASKKLR